MCNWYIIHQWCQKCDDIHAICGHAGPRRRRFEGCYFPIGPVWSLSGGLAVSRSSGRPIDKKVNRAVVWSSQSSRALVQALWTLLCSSSQTLLKLKSAAIHGPAPMLKYLRSDRSLMTWQDIDALGRFWWMDKTNERRQTSNSIKSILWETSLPSKSNSEHSFDNMSSTESRDQTCGNRMCSPVFGPLACGLSCWLTEPTY